VDHFTPGCGDGLCGPGGSKIKGGTAVNIYAIQNIGTLIHDNSYVGRGIVVGKTQDGTKAAVAYFIMGRSENSRNRIFVEKDGAVFTQPFDVSKVEDPSLIIYAALRAYENKLIVTNGDQTDTIYDFLQNGKDFRAALQTREFEPDGPNFTPRISAMLTFGEKDFSYEMSILKSADEKGSACNRYTFNYPALAGLGHFLHTYVCDGNPIPTFQGEPERVEIPNDIDAFTQTLWENLNEQNKISLYVRYVDLTDGSVQNRMINKNK
jgi:IMP cyclohydrolase